MPQVVTERCVDCRYTECATVCPVEAFFEVEEPAMLVIDPDTCIDCGACLPECPINAIVDSEDQAPDWADYNRQAAGMWPNASEARDDWELRDPSEPPHNPDNA